MITLLMQIINRLRDDNAKYDVLCSIQVGTDDEELNRAAIDIHNDLCDKPTSTLDIV
jgi:hypothetical protein